MKKLYIPCEVFSRVCGYFQPIGKWNNGKKKEFEERVKRKAVDMVVDLDRSFDGENIEQ